MLIISKKIETSIFLIPAGMLLLMDLIVLQNLHRSLVIVFVTLKAPLLFLASLVWHISFQE